MKQLSSKSRLIRYRTYITASIFTISSLLLLSFTADKLTNDFLTQLGITKADAETKINNSILGGYLNEYGVRNAKNIPMGNRVAVVKALLLYTKQQVSSVAFIKEYNAMKEAEKPVIQKIQTPEEMRASEIAMYEKSISETEVILKKADESLKSAFEEVLAEAKKGLKEAADPANKNFLNYKRNYADLVKSNNDSYKQQLEQWELKYPTNRLLFIKKRLQQCLDATNDIDFSAQLIEKNGKKYFVNKLYESKGVYWKMAFRAGNLVIEPVREFVQKWMLEIQQ